MAHWGLTGAWKCVWKAKGEAAEKVWRLHVTFAQARVKGTATRLPQTLTSPLRLWKLLARLLLQAGPEGLGPCLRGWDQQHWVSPGGVGAGWCRVAAPCSLLPSLSAVTALCPQQGFPSCASIPTLGLALLPSPHVPLCLLLCPHRYDTLTPSSPPC